jgi:hypothetical protein
MAHPIANLEDRRQVTRSDGVPSPFLENLCAFCL